MDINTDSQAIETTYAVYSQRNDSIACNKDMKPCQRLLVNDFIDTCTSFLSQAEANEATADLKTLLDMVKRRLRHECVDIRHFLSGTSGIPCYMEKGYYSREMVDMLDAMFIHLDSMVIYRP